MKKKTVYNIIMLAVIAAIAAVAVLLAGRHLGWFDKAAPDFLFLGIESPLLNIEYWFDFVKS